MLQRKKERKKERKEEKYRWKKLQSYFKFEKEKEK